jgi:predicted Zn-dependent peptidase
MNPAASSKIGISIRLLSLLGLSVIPALADAQSPLHLDVKERILDNGVTVLVWERPSAGRIGARVFYRVDVAAERPGTVGLTHMLEHYLFMGSFRVGTSDWQAERPFAEAVEQIEREITDERNRNASCFLQRDVFSEVEVHCTTPRLDSLQTALDAAFAEQMRYASGTDFDWIYQPAGGTGLTASTGPDWMKFDIDLPASALELFMWMERSRVENPVFRFFEPEREVVVDQIRRADNRPDGPFERVLRSMTYDAHPYGWAHWFSDLTRATREDHWEIFYRYFIPQNTVIVVVGDIEAEEVFQQANQYWGSWREGRPAPRLRTVEPSPVGEKRLEVSAAAGPAVVIHAPMPAVGHADTPVFEVLAEILGGDQGLLELEVVQARGVATSAAAAATPAKYPSHMMIRANVRTNTDLGAAEEALEAVLERVARGEVEPDRLVAAVDRMVLRLAGGLERVGPSSVQIGAMEVIYGWAHLNQLPELWAGVTVDDLARVIRTYFPREMRTVGVLRRDEGVIEQPVAQVGMLPATELEGHDAATPIGTQEVWSWEPPRARARIPLRPTGSDLAPLGATGGIGTNGRNPDPEEPRSHALAEMPWYAPPWMAGYRPSRFTEPPPVEHWEPLMPRPTAPVLPSAEEARRTLAGGYPAFVARDELLPLVQLTALVRSGSLADPAGQEGLATLTSQVVTRGGANGLTPEAFDARLRALGASLSTQVDGHHTRIYLRVAPEHAEEAARLLAGMVRTPTLDPETFQRERDRIAASAERALDAAPALLQHTFHSALYPASHPLARRARGTSVRALNLDDVARRHREAFQANGVVFALSGRFDEAQILSAMGEVLGRGVESVTEPPVATSGASTSAELREMEPGNRGGLQVVTQAFPSRQGHIMLGHRGLTDIPEDPLEHAALEIMNYILSGGAFVSRMMELLRTDTGITSALYGSVEPGGGIPHPYVWRFSGNPETLATGVRLAVGEIERMRDHGVTQEEFDGAVTSYLQGLIPASYETPQRTVERFAQNALLGRYLYQSPGYLNYYAGDETQVAALLALTLDDVNAVARRWLHPDALVVAVVGPLDEIRAGAGAEDLPFVTP